MDTSAEVGPDGNEEVCRRCEQSGQLVLCDNCPASWHVRCVMKDDPTVAMSVLEQAASWFCPDCVSDRKRQRTGDIEDSDDDRRLLVCDRENRLYVLATDDETLKGIAYELEIDVLELVHMNKRRLNGLGSTSKLRARTLVFVPEEAVRRVAHKFNIVDEGDLRQPFSLPGVPAERSSKPGVFIAEKIIGRRSKPKEEFLVKWEGFSENDATWEPRVNILSDQLIIAFEQNRKSNFSAALREVQIVRRREGEFGLKVLGLSDASSGECWCVVCSSGEGPLPEGLESGDVIVEVDGRYVVHQPFERILEFVAQAKSTVTLTVCKRR